MVKLIIMTCSGLEARIYLHVMYVIILALRWEKNKNVDKASIYHQQTFMQLTEKHT